MTTEVFLAAGLWASAGDKGRWVDLKEVKPAGKPGYVAMSFQFGEVGLKPIEARKLADQLLDLADRTEKRG